VAGRRDPDVEHGQPVESDQVSELAGRAAG
jgi:hypothetical protein